MTSLRSKAVKSSLKLSQLLGTAITPSNLAAKRTSYGKLEKLLPVSKTTTIEYVTTPSFNGEWVIVPNMRPDKVMLYFHGGGFVFDSTKVHRDLISRIATAGHIKALSINYSLAPEHPFPKAIDEALAAYKWLLSQFQSSDIVFAGDSAGGSIVLSLLQVIRGQKLPYPACAIAMSPATDAASVDKELAEQTVKDTFIKPDTLDFFITSYFQSTPRNHPIASPFHGTLRGFPPLLIHADQDEAMYPSAVRFVNKAKAAGVEVTFYKSKGLWHVWHLFARYVPEAKTAIQQIGTFIEKHTV